MRFSQVQEGGFEKVHAQYYLAFNEWWAIDTMVNSRNINMDGIGVQMIMNQEAITRSRATIAGGTRAKNFTIADSENPARAGLMLGKAVQCASLLDHPDFFYSLGFGCGVIDETLRSHEIPTMGLWVNVLVYGYHGFLGSADIADTDALLYISRSTGLIRGVTADVIETVYALRGFLQLTFDGAPANGETVFVDLGGVDQAGGTAADSTWISPPSINGASGFQRDITTGAIVAAAERPPINCPIIGYKFKGAPTVDPNYSNITRFQGFISAMGMNLGRV